MSNIQKLKGNNTIQISIYKIKNKGLKAFDEIEVFTKRDPAVVKDALKDIVEKCNKNYYISRNCDNER